MAHAAPMQKDSACSSATSAACALQEGSETAQRSLPPAAERQPGSRLRLPQRRPLQRRGAGTRHQLLRLGCVGRLQVEFACQLRLHSS